MDHMVHYFAEMNDTFSEIAQFTENENTLNNHFNQTREISLLTGKSIYKAGKGINQIRENSLATVKHPTTEQLNKMNETSQLIKQWFTYNLQNGFTDEEY